MERDCNFYGYHFQFLYLFFTKIFNCIKFEKARKKRKVAYLHKYSTDKWDASHTQLF